MTGYKRGDRVSDEDMSRFGFDPNDPDLYRRTPTTDETVTDEWPTAGEAPNWDHFRVADDEDIPPTVPDSEEDKQRAREEKEREDFEELVRDRLLYKRANAEADARFNTERGTGPGDDGPKDSPDHGWRPADVGEFLDGNVVIIEPKLMPRDDGVCLLYPGKTHSFHGESESGKSLIAQAETARVLRAGGTVAYVDFEADLPNVAGRLLAMGVPGDVLKSGLLYIHPEGDFDATDEARAAYLDLLSRTLDLAVIDGVTDSLLLFGLSGRDEQDFVSWHRKVPRAIARRTGAAVVVVDHVVKDAEGRGRFQLGTQAKMNALDGAAYTITVKQALGVGLRGVIEMRVGKDRPGQIRRHCGPFQKDRTQHAATVVVDSTDGETIHVEIQAPQVSKVDDNGPTTEFRPTAIMEKVSRFLEQFPDSSGNAIESDITGKRDTVRLAVKILADEGYLLKTAKGRGFVHRMIAPYIEKHDPKSDRFKGATP